MTILVVNDKRESIKATIYFYNAAGVEIGQQVVPVGGAEVTHLPDAVEFRFVAFGFKDAVINDLYDYGSTTMEMIPRFHWLAPAAIALVGGYVAIKIFKVRL